MNTRKVFQLAELCGIKSLELYVKRTSKSTIGVYHGEVENFSSADTTVVYARGIYNGKMGYAYTEQLDNSMAKFIVDGIKNNATVMDKEAIQIFKGSEKYKKVKAYNAELEQWSVAERIDALKQLEKDILAADSRVTDSELSLEVINNEVNLVNSYGLKLKHKVNYFVVFASAIVSQDGQTKTAFDAVIDNDKSAFDSAVFARTVVDKSLAKLGGVPCQSKEYPCILNPIVTANLTQFYMQSLKAEQVQKHSSVFEGKLGTEVASKCITISETPIRNDYAGVPFDDEGVATYNKTFIDQGVLTTYAYNLDTASKDGVASTANGFRSAAGKISTDYTTLTIKAGKATEQELIASLQEGVYITDVQGLHAGLNPNSGNFSLQAEGFMIRDGKLAEPIALITVAGNLFELFANVSKVANNTKLTYVGVECPSIQLKSIAVSGK